MPRGQRVETHLRRTRWIVLRGARGEHDADGLLDPFEDARGYFRLMSLGRAVDDPDVVTGAAEVIPHLLKPRAAKETGNRDVADDASAALWVVIEDFPRRPTPEIDIQISQVLAVSAYSPFTRGHPLGEWGSLLRLARLALDPAAAALGFLLVWRIAEHDSDGLLALDRVCGSS